MNKNKKIFGKGAGVLALALALAFGLAACGGDDGGGGGGTTLGESALGETLVITGAQVYNYTMSIDSDEQYEKYTGSDVEFEVASGQNNDGTIGGKVKITGGKLDFTANAATAENLADVKAAGANDYGSLEYEFSRMSQLGYYGLDYTNITITGTDWENAKWAELPDMRHNEGNRSDNLSRESLVYESVNTGDHNYTNVGTSEEAMYFYVDKTITIKADGGTKTTSDPSGDSHYDLKAVDITLEKGWNVLYSKYTDSGVTDTCTYELKAGDPSSVYWLNDWKTN